MQNGAKYGIENIRNLKELSTANERFEGAHLLWSGLCSLYDCKRVDECNR